MRSVIYSVNNFTFVDCVSPTESLDSAYSNHLIKSFLSLLYINIKKETNFLDVNVHLTEKFLIFI